ncbi:hypothetical protein BU14_0397s0003 [Porphyra umbilicalis]|uniref:Uncharacterized protein n=1 Tax=Porphyra umbilicalis TaxID=2786 RepID=A0A1X6NW83_PORUM|nr:hypothetical protein BU14_0397s0003 [Porphyra umbilicalis]|eukprot:OSX72879.1 hypothetical protein BU14_0397s0003 [Porphyra umbilicalis]
MSGVRPERRSVDDTVRVNTVRALRRTGLPSPAIVTATRAA